MSSLLTWTLSLPDSPQSLPWLAIPLSCTTAFSKSSKKYISGCLGRAWEQINCNGGTGDLPGMMELF